MMPNSDFETYDMALGQLDNEFDSLTNASCHHFVSEAVPIQRANYSANTKTFVQWKYDTIQDIRNTFAKFKQYTATQHIKYFEWLRKNNRFFDASVYPCDKSCRLRNAPDYRAAIIRIKEPIANSLNSLDINRIEVSEQHRSRSLIKPESQGTNQWFMKFIIKPYNSDGTDFSMFARNYYYGNDNKSNYNEEQMNSLLRLMFDYCINFPDIVKFLEGQLGSMITFLNIDPITGEQQTEGDISNQIQNYRNSPSNIFNANQSTPQKQLVAQQASAGLLPIGRDLLLEEIVKKSTFSPSSPISNGGSKSFSPTSKSTQNTSQKNRNSSGNKTNKLDIVKKKKIAFNIVKIAFYEKTTAAGRIYKDFITVLQTHVAVIRDKQLKERQRKAKGK